MQDRLNVLYQFNEKYAPYAGVSITSLFENNKAAKSIYIYILGENLSDDSIDRLKKLADRYKREVIFVKTDELIARMKELNMPSYRGSFAANLRMFVSEIAKDENRILYLDADTIVTGDLGAMYESDIKTVGMVYDTLSCDHKYDIGHEKEDGYYNSGVILYDLNKWRDNDFTAKIVDHVANVRAQYPSPDQDLINAVVKSEITALPAEYNYQPHLRVYPYRMFMKVFHPFPYYGEDEISKADKSPVIMHAFRYIGEFPWHKGNCHPFTDEFDKYLKISPWNDYIKVSSDSGIVMTIEKLMYKCLPKVIFLQIFHLMHRNFFKKAEKLSKENKISKSM